MNKFELSLLDVEKFVEVNEIKEITNPIFFKRGNVATEDGLLSNEIFGITKVDRGNIFGYIDLSDVFLHPLAYKIWSRMDKRIIDIAYGTKRFIINSEGDFEENENGETGIGFLEKNIKKIKIKHSDSVKRDTNIQMIEENTDKIFIRKLPVIPPFYRDVNTSGTDSTKPGVGEVNKYYNKILLSVNSIREVADYGLPVADAVKGRIQSIIVELYNWFTDEPNLAKKKGIVRRAVMSKTADYAARLVLSSADIDAERYDEFFVDMEHCALPLSAAIATMYPFILFHTRRFFENEFATGKYPFKDKDGNVTMLTVKDPFTNFSDKVIKHEMDRFIKGFSNRLIPIKVPNEEGVDCYMYFKGRHRDAKEDTTTGNVPIANRRLTWCDVFYRAAHEAAKGKHALLSRYPLENTHGQMPFKIRVASTIDTEPMIIGEEVYTHYPKIREEDIEKNTSNKFKDTLQMANPFIGVMGADFDGDQLTVKVCFSEEGNEELDVYMNKPDNFFYLSGVNGRTGTNESVQAIFNLTRLYDKSMITADVTMVPVGE